MRCLLTLTNLILCFTLLGQHHEHRGGHHHFHIDQSKAYCGPKPDNSLAERQKEAKAFMAWKNTHPNQPRSMLRTIPVVFHLLEYNPSITNEQVERAVSSLNNAFSHSQNDLNGADFSGGPLGVDTRIQFCLAQRAPDGGRTTGIVRWTSDYENMDVDLEDPKLKTQGQWDPRYYLNIWVLNHLDAESDQSYTGRTWWNRKNNIGGYSAGPGGVVGPDARLDGVITTGLGAALVAHEIGHYLALAHTFSSDCNNGDCTVNGDGICDTPPDKSQTGCGDNTCNTDTLSNYSNGNFTTDVPDMTSNFMDYSSCPSEFTQGQADKMWFILDNRRIDLAVEAPSNNDACIQPCDADFNVEFEVGVRYPEPNVAIDFTSSSLGDGIDSYEWYVERLGHPGFNYPIAWTKGYSPANTAIANTPNLNHTFLEPGKYRVYLKAWNSSNPDCYASYSRTLRVTCLGIDARFTPSARFIAAKQPKGKLIDSVIFRNRSVNATEFEWTVQHFPYDSMAPAQPDFMSNDSSLVHTFLEPGDYLITLIASNGPTCRDTCGPFRLPVDDPTIDGEIKITRVDCYKEDSLRIAFKISNPGYDTIRVGTPVTFYDEDPREANPTPKALGTFVLDQLVYGKDRDENFVVILPTTKHELDQLWAVFNDVGTTNFPIVWPKDDWNVMSVKSEFPPSGHNELTYDNNYSERDDYQFGIELEVEGQVDCSDQSAQLIASYWNTRDLTSVEWIPSNGLSCTDCLDPELILPNEDRTQRVILTSEYFCKDTIDLFIPQVKEEVPIPATLNIPSLCMGDQSLNLNQYVTGTNLTWYSAENGGGGNQQPPVPETDDAGTYSYWVSQTINACEGPRAELSYTVRNAPNAPQVNPLSNICLDEAVPDLATAVNGVNLSWYSQQNGGTATDQAPILQSNRAGTFTYWVSQQVGSCEGPRSEVSFTVIDATAPPNTPDSIAICFGSPMPDLNNLVPGSDLLWYPTETSNNGNAQAPVVNTSISRSHDLWVSQISQNCESPKSKIIFMIDEEVRPPEAFLIGDICEGESALSLESFVEGTQLLWYNQRDDTIGQSTTPSINSDIPGIFSLWVTQSINTCESRPVELNYTVRSTPTAPLVNDLPNICLDEAVPDLASTVIGSNLSWYGQQNGGTASDQPPTLQSNSAGTFTYWVSQRVGSCEGPRSEISLTVIDATIPPNAPASIGICFGSPMPDLNDVVSGTDLLWYPTETSDNGNAQAPVINTNISRTHDFWVSQTSRNCESPKSKIVFTVAEEVKPPKTTLIEDLCEGAPTPSLTSLVEGNQLLWYDQRDDTIGQSATPLISSAIPGDFSLWVTQSINACESQPIELNYTVYPIPDIPEITNLPVLCVGGPVPNLNQFLNGNNLSWYAVPNGGLANPDPPKISTDSAHTFQYWISQSQLGCESPKTSIEMVVSDIQITPGGPYEVIEGNSQEIDALVDVFPANEPYDITWLNEDQEIIDQDQLQTTIQPTKPTFYSIEVETNSCIEQEEIFVDLIYLIDPTQTFSPNGDGKNDVWYIDDIDKYPQSNLTVFNRWGSIVYQTQGYQNDWQGTWQDGSDLPVATYYFVIDLNQDNTTAVTGNVTIIR